MRLSLRSTRLSSRSTKLSSRSTRLSLRSTRPHFHLPLAGVKYESVVATGAVDICHEPTANIDYRDVVANEFARNIPKESCIHI